MGANFPVDRLCRDCLGDTLMASDWHHARCDRCDKPESVGFVEAVAKKVFEKRDSGG